MKALNLKAIPYLLLIVLALAVVFIRMCRTGSFSSADYPNQKTSPERGVNRNRGFDRRTSFLEYTPHAQCRMDCRHINKEEVEEIMHTGKINYRKSEAHARPCPTYALEGTTHDNQRIRIVFAQCDFKTKVVTTIDLDRDWICDCPGDN